MVVDAYKRIYIVIGNGGSAQMRRICTGPGKGTRLKLNQPRRQKASAPKLPFITAASVMTVMKQHWATLRVIKSKEVFNCYKRFETVEY
jgi:hypothetical protein